MKQAQDHWKKEYQHSAEGVRVCIADSDGNWIADCGAEGSLEAETNAEAIIMARNAVSNMDGGSLARKKVNYVGAPAIFALELEAHELNKAFGGQCYLVGSSLERADWRDIDVRLMLDDKAFKKLFPDASQHWECDPRWLILTVSLSAYLSKATGLPIDFQIQPTTEANRLHKGARHALGIRITNRK